MLRHQMKEAEADICLIGSRLPDEDALALIRELRMTSCAGLIMLGDSADEVDTVLALEMGADDYIAKPLRLRELAARTRSVIRSSGCKAHSGASDGLPREGAPSERSTRMVGDLKICGVSRMVLRGGDPVDLTTLEFDVLMVLCSAANTVLTRARIVEAVHGRDWSANDRTVDGIISRLRRKLFDEDEGNWRIRTVHRRGYMLVDVPSEGT
jgi:DNA-binding response OmpR family regulator